MKMLLIVPRSEFLISDHVMPPLGAMAIKAAAVDHQVDICDGPSRNLECDIVGISCTTPQYHKAVDIARDIKYFKPDMKIVIGGPHMTHNYEEIDSVFDYVFVGDAELDINNFLTKLPNCRVTYGRKVLNEENWRSIPITWRDKSFLSKYEYKIKGVLATTMITGLYCPMACGFCEHSKTGVSLKPIDVIKREIDDIVNCGYKAIMFYDDIFTINKKRVSELCATLKPYNLTFRCFAHASSFDDEMAKMLYDAGCKVVCWGAESCDNVILKTIGKTTTCDDNYRMARTIINNNMDAVAFCMIGLPGENYDTIKATEDFIASFSTSDRFSFDYTIYYPYKGTNISRNRDKYDIKISYNNSIGYYKGVGGESECCISTSKLSAEDIIREKHRICAKYNFTGKQKR